MPQPERSCAATSSRTIRAEKNGLLPSLNAYAFYGGSGVGGSKNSAYTCTDASFNPVPCTGQYAIPESGYGTTIGNSFNNSSCRALMRYIQVKQITQQTNPTASNPSAQCCPISVTSCINHPRANSHSSGIPEVR